MIHRLLNALILLPDAYHYQAPADLGLCAEAVTFPNRQGLLLQGLLCWKTSQEPSPSLCPDDLPVILFCPGTSGNLSAHLHYIELLCRAGFAVLGFDYTGFGRSAGMAWLKTLLTDVLCAADYLRKQRHIERFGLFGLSISANVVLLAATLRPASIAGVAVEGITLQTEIVRGILTHGVMGPRYIPNIAYDGVPQCRQPHVLNPFHMPKWLANIAAPLGMAGYPFQAKDPLRSATRLKDIPVFFIHGVEDPLLPFEATLEVYDAKPGVKRLWLMPGVGHAQEAVLANDGEYTAQLSDFFHDVLSNSAHAKTPTLSWEVSANHAGRPMLQLYNNGPPGAVLTTFISDQAADFTTTWVDDAATLPIPTGHPFRHVHSLRLFEAVQGSHATVQCLLTSRGQRYQTVFRPYIRALSRLLHESRLSELGDCLKTLPQSKPEAPFDFFLGVYCIQIIRRSRKKFPHLAKAAAEAFTCYWPYGAGAAQDAPHNLWGLATSVLNKAVKTPASGRTNL
ncbi:MAG: alpha/beta hydrolase [bacterium]|nr:alpha/beta hydrolase [bacterium]